MMWFIWVVVLWFALGALASGLAYAHFQRKYAIIADRMRDSDLRLAIFCFVAGPAGLLATLICGQFTHGWLMPGTVDKKTVDKK